jgi:hypothetical protein
MKLIEAQNYVDLIIKDLHDRRRIGNEWCQIDKNIQEEIRNAWVDILLEYGSSNNKVIGIKKKDTKGYQIKISGNPYPRYLDDIKNVLDKLEGK